MGDCLFRRRQLAQLGSATGVYKTLVKYLVGVPQVDILDLFFFWGLISFLASLDLCVHLSNPRKWLPSVRLGCLDYLLEVRIVVLLGAGM